MRPPAERPAGRSSDLRGLADAMADAVAGLPGEPPDEADYQATAAQLGRWENEPGPYLPLRPQGHIETGQDRPPPGWPPGLVLARDLMLASLLPPTLAAAQAAPGQIAGYALQVLALAAATHPAGPEIGTLPYRSHSEAMLSWKAGPADPRAAFRDRYESDAAEFAAALADPAGGAPPGQAQSLRQWEAAIHRCWGIATALTLSGQIDRSTLNDAGQLREPPDQLRQVARSSFHQQLHDEGFTAGLPHWHLAHRLVVNVLYQSLACLGLTATQRYYLCYGLSEATDRSLGRSWSQRLTGYAHGGTVTRPASAAAPAGAVTGAR
ncbi:MAG TPA: hypothetical protein VGM53_14170 [Streptosporangiaceae bacterium]